MIDPFHSELPLLSLFTFAPAFGAALLLCTPGMGDRAVKTLATIFGVAPLAAALLMWSGFDTVHGDHLQFVEQADWIPAYGIQFFLGVDGFSAPLVVLSAIVGLVAIVSSYDIGHQMEHDGRPGHLRGYFALLLLLFTGMNGVFVSLDFFLFYVFWEVMLIPMYFLIGMWGAQKRVYAAIKFFLYTMAGSILMLIGIIVMYYTYRDAVGTPSFSLIAWREHWEVFAKATVTLGGATWSKADLVFLLFFIGFAIKVPIFPFHTWLPWAHVQAPTAVSVILAGVLLKMGTYGYLRVTYPLCPQAAMALAVPIGVLGVINIIYGACCAMAQNDMKSLVAYSSVSHMGYCMLGLAAMTPYGVMGSALQQFNHGTSTSMMFLLVGVIYDRAHHKFIRYPTDYPDPAKAGQPGFGGLASALPMYTGIFAVAMFASMGLPGLSGFVSEVLVFLGAFQGQAHEAARNLTGVAGTSFQTLTVVSVTGVILTAGYLLWMFQRVFFGPLNKEYAGLPDLNAREIVTLAPLAGIVLFFGVWPLPLLDLMDQTVQTFVAQMNAAAAMPKLGAPWPSGMPFIGH